MTPSSSPKPMNTPPPAGAKTLRLLAIQPRGRMLEHPIRYLENALAARGVLKICNDAAISSFIARALRKLNLLRNLTQSSRYANFCPIMQISEHRLFPQCFWSESIVYCFDCWPAAYPQWESFLRRQKIHIAFFSAKQSADYLRDHVPGLEAIWMPEAIDLSHYSPTTPLASRKTDVLELGRRYDAYHDQIAAHCAARNYVHRFEKTKGEIIFPTTKELYAGLADAKISICFPSSLTHPARSGDVETLTLRYLESMASRCIVIGRCPTELRELFGYDPMLESDMTDPCGQLDHVLSHLASFEPLLDRNLNRLRQVGTWDTRVESMLEMLRNRGYRCEAT